MTTPQPIPIANLPPEARARLRELRKRLPPDWTVARIMQYGSEDWIVEFKDLSGLTVGQLALWVPGATGQAKG